MDSDLRLSLLSFQFKIRVFVFETFFLEIFSYKETFTYVHNIHSGPDREIGDPNSNYNRLYYINSGASGMKWTRFKY